MFGYYIEVPNAFKELVPETYIRKQTLANCERFITEELKALEAKVLSAQERITGLEYEIFSAVREKVADQFTRIQRTAAAVAALDTLCSFAQVAEDQNYVCPCVTDERTLEIREGRQPVVERMLDGAPFVPNDTLLDCGDTLAPDELTPAKARELIEAPVSGDRELGVNPATAPDLFRMLDDMIRQLNNPNK